MTIWDPFYAKSITMPSQEHTTPFLEHVRGKGRILDFGSGTGIWAAAFRRDRPDTVTDLVDLNAPDSRIITQAWPGKIYQMDCAQFVPPQRYAGIWANNVLSYLPRDQMQPTFHRLVNALEPGGITGFTFFATVDHAPAQAISLSQPEIESMLEAGNLHLYSIFLNKDAEYMIGDAGAKKKFPTYHVQALKRFGLGTN